jgi:seryl-tRNA synthetase
MREFVCIGAPEQVTEFREHWTARARDIAAALGLAHEIVPASDPFFGRTGRVKAVSQVQQSLKLELVVPVRSADEPTACMSFNCHRDHFGAIWGLRTADGEVAHTGCVAFGIDRLALALFSTHGLDSERWPAPVKSILRIHPG